MPGTVRKKQTDPFLRALNNGEPYGCLGQHLLHDPACDGDKPCRWRGTCRIYQEFCEHRGVDPVVELGMMPVHVIRPMIKHLVANHIPGYKIPEARVLRGWDRFHDAFVSELRRPVVHPSAELARRGELYVVTWKGRSPGQYRARIIRARRQEGGTARWDTTLCRYHPSVRARVTPTIEFAVDLRVLLEQYPHARHLAYRWRGSTREFRPIGAVAVKVYTERIDDCGRLLCRLLEDGLIEGVRLDRKRGRVKVKTCGGKWA